MAQQQTPYDTIPYRSNPFRQSRPERLAAVAKLFGLNAPAVDSCRVLELGCSMGGNLLVMAQDHPGSRFIGIDSSSRQIADGWKMVDLLGLKNLQLKHMDILDIGSDLGQFDYIISHGVYSWVPAPVQNRMLEICQRHLAPNGVAYISYNTYPGWHVRGVVRDMMLYRGMQISDPAARLAQAKSLVEFVAQATRGGDTPYTRLLQGELKIMGQMEDYYLHHEHLEENNHPLYFHEFARRLTVNGLQYLGEADFSTMISTNFAPEVAKTLNELGAHDIVQMEQYMDFVRCRYFRQTLICHSGIRLNRTLTPGVVKDLLLASPAAPASAETVLAATHTETFQTPGGHGISCKSPLTKLALLELRRQWPMPVAFADLLAHCKAAAARAGHPVEEANVEEFFAGEILSCMAVGVAEWRLTPVPFTTVVGATPATSPLARYQAGQGYSVTNLRGENVTLDEIHRQALKQLDGSRDLKSLSEALLASVRQGTLVLQRESDKSPVTDEKEMRQLLGPALEKVLVNLAKKALLLRQDAT
jgi:methyltransferase-like protein/2-polyprenyl-3-methyl-5-hydroxy-6-metoxy-1,4-benzoquinol methylase